MSLQVKEIIEYNEVPTTVYCEDGTSKYIASWIKSEEQVHYYILYPVADRSEYDETENWRSFVDHHSAKQRANSTQFVWN